MNIQILLIFPNLVSNSTNITISNSINDVVNLSAYNIIDFPLWNTNLYPVPDSDINQDTFEVNYSISRERDVSYSLNLTGNTAKFLKNYIDIIRNNTTTIQGTLLKNEYGGYSAPIKVIVNDTCCGLQLTEIIRGYILPTDLQWCEETCDIQATLYESSNRIEAMEVLDKFTFSDDVVQVSSLFSGTNVERYPRWFVKMMGAYLAWLEGRNINTVTPAEIDNHLSLLGGCWGVEIEQPDATDEDAYIKSYPVTAYLTAILHAAGLIDTDTLPLSPDKQAFVANFQNLRLPILTTENQFLGAETFSRNLWNTVVWVDGPQTQEATILGFLPYAVSDEEAMPLLTASEFLDKLSTLYGTEWNILENGDVGTTPAGYLPSVNRERLVLKLGQESGAYDLTAGGRVLIEGADICYEGVNELGTNYNFTYNNSGTRRQRELSRTFGTKNKKGYTAFNGKSNVVKHAIDFTIAPIKDTTYSVPNIDTEGLIIEGEFPATPFLYACNRGERVTINNVFDFIYRPYCANSWFDLDNLISSRYITSYEDLLNSSNFLADYLFYTEWNLLATLSDKLPFENVLLSDNALIREVYDLMIASGNPIAFLNNNAKFLNRMLSKMMRTNYEFDTATGVGLITDFRNNCNNIVNACFRSPSIPAITSNGISFSSPVEDLNITMNNAASGQVGISKIDNTAYKFTPIATFTLEKENATCDDLNNVLSLIRKTHYATPSVLTARTEVIPKLSWLKTDYGVGIAKTATIDWAKRSIRVEGDVIPFIQAGINLANA